MRYLAFVIIFFGLASASGLASGRASGSALAARARSADKATVVVDCKTAITSSTAAGIGIRVVTGGAVPGMQAYVHELPSTNSKIKQATFVDAVEVRYGIKPTNDTVEFVIVPTDPARKFHLTIRKEKDSNGESKAVLAQAELGGNSFGSQSLVCTLGASGSPRFGAGLGAGLGQLCGGIAAIQCTEGLTCQMTGPSHPDQAGTCVRSGAGLGQLCGGIAGIQCAEGLTCKMTGPSHPDQSGTCVRAGAGLGQLCGGIAGIQCAEGLTCKMTGPSHPDQAGTCVRR